MTNDPTARVLHDLDVAATAIAPQWPLSSTVAVNPLAGFEDRPFDDAVGDAAQWFGARGRLTEADYRAAWPPGGSRPTRSKLPCGIGTRTSTTWRSEPRPST